MTSSQPAWTEHPAPRPLEKVQHFLNTHAYSGRPDALADVETAHAWLIANGFRVSGLRPVDLDAMRELRTVLRGALLGVVFDEERAREASSSLRLGVRIDADGAQLEPVGSGVSGVLSAFAVDVAIATARGLWKRLKICRNEECAVVFWDLTKGRTARYCSPSVCANRERQRAFRARRRSDSSSGP
jgi:hypothetical protein